MKKYKPIQIKSLSFNIKRFLLRLSCLVFLVISNCSLIFGQNNLCCRLQSGVPVWGTDNTGAAGGGGTITSLWTISSSLGAQSTVYIVQPEKYKAPMSVPIKTFLQGAFNAVLGRHKDVTATWASVLNANALSQPYGVAPFSYTGTESVSSGFFTSTAGTTDIVDWILLEVRAGPNAATIVTRRAAFIREDGMIVELDGISPVSFLDLADGNYSLVIRHRNHLAIRTPIEFIKSPCGTTLPSSHDFSTAQTQAYQNPAITNNPAMKNLGGGVFGMWGGNGNSDGQVRVTGLPSINDFLFLMNALGNNPANIFSNVYNRADLNMDGTIRASGLPSINDYLFLTGALDNNPAKIISQHQ